MVNVREFYAAGLGFSIVDADADFDSKGELRGYREVKDELYQSGTGEDFEREGMVDTLEMSDDSLVRSEKAGYDDDGQWQDADFMVGRWAHVKEGHLSEMKREVSILLAPVDFQRRIHGEMEMMAKWRRERFERLLAHKNKFGASYKFKREIWKRYIQSVKSCARTESWWALYLTRNQVEELVR